jgi:hypothetical protein
MKKSNLAENLQRAEGQRPEPVKAEVVPIREGLAEEVREKTLAQLREDLNYQQGIVDAVNAFEGPQHHELAKTALHKTEALKKQIKELEEGR